MNLEEYLIQFEHWFQLWRININKNKSTHITISVHLRDSSPLLRNEKIIPGEYSDKYLGIYLDKRLT